MTCLPCTPAGSWMSQPHAGEKRRSEHEDTSQPAKRGRLNGQCCGLVVKAHILIALYCIPSVASLKDLMSILRNTAVPSNIQQFGIMLDFDKSVLDYIQAKNQTDVYQSLIDLLDIWLKRVNPPPSWNALFEALQSLGEEVVVLEMKEKYQLQ